MKAQREQVGLAESNRSFKYFQRIEAGFTPYWHFHPELELTYIEKGKGIRYVGDSILPFNDHDLVLLGGNLPHQWVSAEDSAAHVIQFRKEDLLEIKEIQQMEELLSSSGRGLQFREDEQIIRVFKSLAARSQLGRLSGLIEILDSLTSCPFTPLTSEHYLMTHSAGFRKVQEVNQYVLDHLARKITIQEVAELTHMTRESFCRWFKKETGNTFIDFLNATRIEFATRLLVDRGASMLVSAIGYQVGFDSVSQFNRVFKQKKGLSPLQYRQKVMNLV